MRLNGLNIFLYFITSIIGLAYFIYGKKDVNFSFLLSGIALMAYPYFVNSSTWIIIIGIIICAIPIIINRR